MTNIDAVATALLKIIKDAAPNPNTRGISSTGNLAYNAVRMRWIDRDKGILELYIDQDIAPYAKYENAKITWKDGTPYEYHEWWAKVAETVAKYIASLTKGNIN